MNQKIKANPKQLLRKQKQIRKLTLQRNEESQILSKAEANHLTKKKKRKNQRKEHQPNQNPKVNE